MIKKIAFIFVLLLVYACGSKDETTKIPEYIIPPDRMVSIIVDFHLVEASVNQGQQRHEDINQITNYRYNSVLKKHLVNRIQFSKSLMYYSNHIKVLEAIYKQVVVELSTMQGRIISK